jgi:RNA polymerase sigma-70 factor (ECF subfamily)
MAESPKRRKHKDNPYTIKYIESKNIYVVSFKDVKGKLNKVEVSEKVYRVFDKFELQDIKELNEYDRHIEHSEIFENNLEARALNKQIPTDEIVENKINMKLTLY